MHVAHVMPTLAACYGGPVNTALNLGIAQTEIGLKVSHWATGDGETRRKVYDSRTDVRVFEARWPRRWFRSPELARKLNNDITSFDLIEVHGIWEHTVFMAAQIARRAGIPYVIRPTGVFTHPWRYRTLKKQLYLTLIGNRVLKGAACLHVASQKEAEGCLEAGFNIPITIIPNGINPKTFEKLPNPGDAEDRWPILNGRRVILFLSRISREKGLDQCIPAMRDLLDINGFNDVIFVIAGPDHKGYLATLKELLARYELEKYVFFLGMVQGYEKLALYRRADIFVLPSYSENYGIVVAEALASGTPVVTTTGTPWKELVDIDAGRWVAPERGQLAKALCELLEMPRQTREIMGQRGREMVLERHTWQKAARKLYTVYRCILEGEDIPMNPELT
ncbi:MAG: glycosyltransferase [Planctomycetota bacterium]|jgi:glycosyltransferase involved in cell wall biosynthesis